MHKDKCCMDKESNQFITLLIVAYNLIKTTSLQSYLKDRAADSAPVTTVQSG